MVKLTAHVVAASPIDLGEFATEALAIEAARDLLARGAVVQGPGGLVLVPPHRIDRLVVAQSDS